MIGQQQEQEQQQRKQVQAGTDVARAKEDSQSPEVQICRLFFVCSFEKEWKGDPVPQERS